MDDETRLDWATDLPGHLPPGTKRGWEALYGGPPSPVPRFGMLDGYHRDENGHYWHPSAVERFPMTRQYAQTAPLDETKIMEVLKGGRITSVVQAPPARHVSRKVYKARKRRTPVQRALLWSAIIIVVAATLAAAVPVAGLVCLAHCPVP